MNIDVLLNHEFPVVTHTYDDNFTMMYALSVGLGAEPLDRDQLRYVYEDGLQTLPTMAVVLATPGFWAQDPRFGIDWKRVLHGEQALTVHRPLPIEGTVNSQIKIVAIDDKGPDKGAVIHSERSIVDATSGELLASLAQTTFCRGDGGFGGENPRRFQNWVKPDRDPDHRCALHTAPNSALLYRLTGDRNPLHADPDVAAVGGFGQPILHGLCTYAVIGHALVRSAAGYDATRLRALSGRFSSPVTPGEVITTSIWQEPAGLLFEAHATNGRVVFTHGRALISA